MWIRTLALVIALLTQANAGVHRGRASGTKIFPAQHSSVALENEVAQEMGADRFLTQEQVDEAVYAGRLAALYNHTYYRVSPKLPINRRYALPATVAFVEQLSLEFFNQFHAPLMVDSAIRPATTQKWLMHRNRNAAPWDGPRASSHLRGTTVDFSSKQNKQEHAWLVYRFLYYRAIGSILIIQERNCWHVFVKGDYGNSADYRESVEAPNGYKL